MNKAFTWGQPLLMSVSGGRAAFRTHWISGRRPRLAQAGGGQAVAGPWVQHMVLKKGLWEINNKGSEKSKPQRRNYEAIFCRRAGPRGEKGVTGGDRR